MHELRLSTEFPLSRGIVQSAHVFFFFFCSGIRRKEVQLCERLPSSPSHPLTERAPISSEIFQEPPADCYNLTTYQGPTQVSGHSWWQTWNGKNACSYSKQSSGARHRVNMMPSCHCYGRGRTHEFESCIYRRYDLWITVMYSTAMQILTRLPQQILIPSWPKASELHILKETCLFVACSFSNSVV